MRGNREYKNDVFCMLLEEPENALQVYNALNGSDYEDKSLVKMKAIEGGIALSVKNDASFIVGSEINMYEHQSSYNPNMPLRHLFYISDILEEMTRGRDLYSRKKINIPLPHFVVFYNGMEKRPAQETLRLSELFEKHTDEPELELICTVYNINPDYGEEILKKCGILNEYTMFVETIREGLVTGSSLEDAINKAIDICLERGILKDLLQKRRDEVTRITMIDMTFETREKLIRQESYEDGIEQGIEQVIVHMLKRGKTISEVAELCGYSEEFVREAEKRHKTEE